MEVISYHKKRGGKQLWPSYRWTPPAAGKRRAQVIVGKRTKHIDV